MESREISCETFRIVFGTNVSEQGKCNLVRHEEECSICGRFAELKRMDASAPEITCERFWELETPGKGISEGQSYENGSQKHYRECLLCRTRLDEIVSRRMVEALCKGIKL